MVHVIRTKSIVYTCAIYVITNGKYIKAATKLMVCMHCHSLIMTIGEALRVIVLLKKYGTDKHVDVIMSIT